MGFAQRLYIVGRQWPEYEVQRARAGFRIITIIFRKQLLQERVDSEKVYRSGCELVHGQLPIGHRFVIQNRIPIKGSRCDALSDRLNIRSFVLLLRICSFLFCAYCLNLTRVINYMVIICLCGTYSEVPDTNQKKSDP